MSKKLESIDVDKLTYEEAFNELTSLVEALESEGNPLDETMIMFERGQALSQRCTTLLEQAELKVQQLSGDKLVDLEVD